MWQEKFIKAILKHRKAVLAVTILITAVAGFFASKVRFDNSIEIWFMENDPNLVSYHEFLDLFGGDEITVIGLFGDDVFSPESLSAIDRITRAAEEAPFVSRVRSLSNFEIVRGSGGFVEVSPLVDYLPETAEEAEEIRSRADDSNMLEGLYGHDYKSTAIVVEMLAEGNDFESKVALVNALKEISERESGHLEYELAGTPPLDEAFFVYSQRDFEIFGPVAFILVVICVYFVFRRFSAVFVPISVVVIADIWMAGVMGALGLQINIVSSSLFAVVLAVGIADTIHVLADYYQQLMKGHDEDEAIVISFGELLVPCLFTSFTTMAGMLSLLVSNLQPMREFGWLAAMGVFFAFVVSMVYGPVVLHIAKPPKEEFIERQKQGPMSRALALLGRPTKKSSAIITVVSLSFAAVCGYALTWLTVGTNPMDYFREGDPYRLSTERVETSVGGSAAVDCLVRAPGGGMKEPDNLRRLEEFQDFVRGFEGVTDVFSATTVLKEVDRLFELEPKAKGELPTTRAMAAQYYLMLEGSQDFDALIQSDYDIGRITARARMMDADELAHQIPHIQEYIDKNFTDDDLQVTLTGYIKLMGDMEIYLLDSQLKSVALAFIVITLALLILLRSFKLAALSLIPNVIPIFLGLGVMSMMGIALDPGTVMIGSIMLGLVVDDTVHFLVRFKRNSAEEPDLVSAINATIQQTGRPIIITSIILSAGFSVMVLGSFNPNVNFGVISAVVIMLAMVCDLVTLPAVLVLLRINLKK